MDICYQQLSRNESNQTIKRLLSYTIRQINFLRFVFVTMVTMRKAICHYVSKYYTNEISVAYFGCIIREVRSTTPKNIVVV